MQEIWGRAETLLSLTKLPGDVGPGDHTLSSRVLTGFLCSSFPDFIQPQLPREPASQRGDTSCRIKRNLFKSGPGEGAVEGSRGQKEESLGTIVNRSWIISEL